MSISEFEIIQQIFQQQTMQRDDVRLGIGDDAAVLQVPEGNELVVSMDTSIAGVHFPEQMKPKDVGYRALAVNLSDLAAMGAEPAWATLALTLPEANQSWLTAFASGFFSLAKQHNVKLIGGDITRGDLSITVQIHGFVPADQALQRSGAKAADLIYVTGNLGDAAAGLRAWQENSPATAYLRERLSRPTPRVDVGLALRDIANSMIDISDGLLADLGHILSASSVGAIIDLEDLPLSLALCDEVGIDKARELALYGGDDYELCFTVPAEQRDAIDAINNELDQTDLHLIGTIVEDAGLQIRFEGSNYEPDLNGYQHF